MRTAWISHPSGEYRREGQTIHVRLRSTPGTTEVYDIPGPELVEGVDCSPRNVRCLRKSLDDALKEAQRLSDDRDHWEQEAENLKRDAEPIRLRISSLGTMLTAFSSERTKHRDPAIRASVDRLQLAAEVAVYRENEQGGHARQVVAKVARVLGVDIDEGPGHRWDPDHMARVVAVADQIRDERDEAREQAELWKSLAQRQDNTAPVRRALRVAERERDELRGMVSHLKYQVAGLTSSDDVEELEATIVRQAREITQLKGESE
ncbi:hypothetical protein [Streptomyces sp. NBC_00076]|uniref:hypothetical protein n=1 Tax=Streptomyces sp. NBC_00076 TaxID=2975642 RepID=UPI00324C0C6A